jgi:hypothetical protein
MPLRNVTDGATQIKLDGKNRTGTHVSTNIVLTIDGLPIGAVQSFSISEKRSIATVDEVGTDGHIDSVPSKSTDISGSCTRTRFGGKRLAEAFYRGFVHVSAQRVPFDITIMDFIRGSDANQIVTTVIENVWIESMNVKYGADNFVIADDMNWVAESIHSYTNGGDSAILDPSLVYLNQFEKEADTGLYRGSLDGAGLIYAFQGTRGVISVG